MSVIPMPPKKSSHEEMRQALAEVAELIDVMADDAGLFVVAYDGGEPCLVAVANLGVPELIASAFAVATEQVPILLGDDFFDFDE